MFIWTDCIAQSIDADFYGSFKKSVNLLSYDSVRLDLNDDYSFTLKYSNPAVCAAYTQSNRFCSGTYNLFGDTLILKSKYQESDFYTLKELKNEHFQSDSILIVLTPSKQVFLKGSEIIVSIDSVPSGRYKIGDTISVSITASSLILSSRCLYDMDWKVDLKKRNASTLFALKLKLEIDEENISLNDTKFLMNDDELLMMKNFFFINIRDKRLKKKQPSTKK